MANEADPGLTDSVAYTNEEYKLYIHTTNH